jgi:hypothetical protein
MDISPLLNPAPEQTTDTTGVIPSWWKDVTLCHINEGDSGKAFCGALLGKISCPTEYDGSALCADCGNPTCPRCAQLEALDYELEA